MQNSLITGKMEERNHLKNLQRKRSCSLLKIIKLKIPKSEEM